MVYLSILLFFVYTLGLGFTATCFVRNSENFLERNLMRIGIGLAILPFLGIILSTFKIPIDWRIMLALSLAYPVYHFIRNRPKFEFKITKPDLTIFVVLLIFLGSLYVYASGAFSYPYLEDDDPWSHASGIKYISIEKDVHPEKRYFHYTNPYPPSYDLLMGLLHQTNDSLYSTLKFFNALLVSLAVIFFFFFVKEFTNSRNKALFATFALASIPAFLSHFIWALALAVPLYFVCFYALERIKHDNKWWIVAALCMATVFTATPTHSTYFGFFFIIYIITKMLLEKKILWHHSFAGLLGLSLSAGFWWIPMLVKYGLRGMLEGIGFGYDVFLEDGPIQAFRGTGDRIYSFSDFFIAKEQNMINNPIGIGIVLSLLTLIGLIFLFLSFKENLKEENQWMIITLIWFIFTLYAVNAARFPVKLSPFRAWMLLAIPVCILATQGAFYLLSLGKRFGGNIAKYSILALLIVGIYFTSAQQKIAVNTSTTWPPGGFWTSNEEIVASLWMRENLEKNSPVFTFANDGVILGMDMYTCQWCDDIRDYKKSRFNETAEETHDWLKSKGYQYLIIDGQTFSKYGSNQSIKKLQDITSSGLFNPVFNNDGAIIFKI